MLLYICTCTYRIACLLAALYTYLHLPACLLASRTAIYLTPWPLLIDGHTPHQSSKLPSRAIPALECSCAYTLSCTCRGPPSSGYSYSYSYSPSSSLRHVIRPPAFVRRSDRQTDRQTGWLMLRSFNRGEDVCLPRQASKQVSKRALQDAAEAVAIKSPSPATASFLVRLHIQQPGRGKS